MVSNMAKSLWTYVLTYMNANAMGIILVLGVLFLAFLFIRAQYNKANGFDFFDLFMENGVASRTGTAFMVVLGVTTWVIVYLMLKDKLTEGYLSIYGVMWVGPLVAKVVFNKSDVPLTTTLTHVETTRTETAAMAPKGDRA